MNLFNRKQQQTENVKVESVIKTGSKIPLTPIFQDALGRNWYEFQNAMTIPAKRAIAAEVATKMQEMNITKETLLQLMAKMKEHANQGKIVELFAILNEIEFRLNFIGEEETLINLAACYFVIEGEDETDFSEVDKVKKVNYIKENKEAFNFFVQRAFEYTTNYSQMSEIDIQEFLLQNAQNAERLKKHLLSLRY
jgi:hypothetical protein